MINIAPGWYGGELANIISNDIETDTMQDGILVGELGFLFEDFETNQEIWLHGRDHSHLRFYLWQEGRRVSSGKQEDQHQMESEYTTRMLKSNKKLAETLLFSRCQHYKNRK